MAKNQGYRERDPLWDLAPAAVLLVVFLFFAITMAVWVPH